MMRDVGRAEEECHRLVMPAPQNKVMHIVLPCCQKPLLAETVKTVKTVINLRTGITLRMTPRDDESSLLLLL